MTNVLSALLEKAEVSATERELRAHGTAALSACRVIRAARTIARSYRRNSFLLDIHVVTADGIPKPIAEVVRGDRVRAANDVTGGITFSPVTDVVIGDGLKSSNAPNWRDLRTPTKYKSKQAAIAAAQPDARGALP
ncbi:hypothetical protein [Streptomyces griseus]|uniref:hypothetical protein n=1 Tax=Streptomyces griseus TaxID=1911 RepID=UPI003418034F